MACAFGNFAFSLLPACALLCKAWSFLLCLPVQEKAMSGQIRAHIDMGGDGGVVISSIATKEEGYTDTKRRLCTPTWDLSLSCVTHIRPVKFWASWLLQQVAGATADDGPRFTWNKHPADLGKGKSHITRIVPFSFTLKGPKWDLKENTEPGTPLTLGARVCSFTQTTSTQQEPGAGPGFPRSENQSWICKPQRFSSLKWGCVAFLPTFPWMP